MTRHTYPSGYPPNHPAWFIRMSWSILDQLAPGRIDNDTRFYLAGLIGGALHKVHAMTLKGEPIDTDLPEPQITLDHLREAFIQAIDTRVNVTAKQASEAADACIAVMKEGMP